MVRGLLGPMMTQEAELTRVRPTRILLRDLQVGKSRVQQEAMAKIPRGRSEVSQTRTKERRRQPEDLMVQRAGTRRVVVVPEEPGAPGRLQ